MAIPFLKVKTRLGLDDTLRFGRHQGYTILEIIKDRPEYIQWLIDNTDLKFYESVHNEVYNAVLKFRAPVARKTKYYNSNNMMPDYDIDTLGDWFDDVPF